MPVWHVSTSLRRRSRRVVDPDVLETAAIATLADVGGPWERWRISPNGVGHLHVPVTDDEARLIPPGQVVADAGDTGPERPRTR